MMPFREKVYRNIDILCSTTTLDENVTSVWSSYSNVAPAHDTPTLKWNSLQLHFRPECGILFTGRDSGARTLSCSCELLHGATLYFCMA